MTLGERIRYFRKRRGMSQFELELQIESSHGHISKIEKGEINPTKETIIHIASVLELNTFEIASLFGIDLSDINHLFKEATRILSMHDLRDILDTTVNDLILKMGYPASLIMLVEGDRVHFSALTRSKLAEQAIAYLDSPLERLSLSLSRDLSNLAVKAIKENRVYFTHNTWEYTVPAVTRETADKIQKVTGDKSNIIYPLSTDDRPFGAIVYVKKVVDDFRDERDTLEVISKQIAVAIQNAKKFEALLNFTASEKFVFQYNEI